MEGALIGIKRMSLTFKSVGVLIEYSGAFLLCKRAPNAAVYPNFWSVPAGHIEKGESPQLAALRELYEETRIDLSAQQLKFISNINNFGLYYYKSPLMYYPVLDIEHIGYAYFPGPEVMNLSPIDTNLVSEIRNLLTNKQKFGTL